MRRRRTRLLAAAFIAALAPTAAAQQRETIRIVVARASVHQTPSDRGTVVTQLPYGTDVELAGRQGDWFRVYVMVGGLRVEAYVSNHAAVLLTAGGSAAAPAASRPATGLAADISIAAKVGSTIVWLTAVPVRAVPVAGQFGTLAALGAGRLIDDAAVGGTPAEAVASGATWAWIASRDPAPPSLNDRSPSFFASYQDVPGVNVAEWTPVVVTLVPAGPRWSIVTMARGRIDAEWTPTRDFQQQTTNANISPGGAGMMNVALAAPLAPGDYAIVLRPAFARKYPGEDVLSDSGIGGALSLAWPFRIR